MTIELFDVQVTHEGRTLVDVPRLTLRPGRAVTIVGESGSGKSLLAHALMGSLPHALHATGEIHLGPDRSSLTDTRARRKLWGRRLALLPQEPVLALDPTMRVHHQVAEGHPRFLHGRRGRAEALELAGTRLAGLGLGGTEQAYPHTLSGGMAQRVAFAAATIGGAEVLIADEPSKGLDTGSRDALARLLTRHVDQGGSLLTITHDLDLARAVGGTLLVMRQAGIVEQGPTEQVLARPAHTWTQRLLAAQPRRWTPPWRDTTPDPAAGTTLITGSGLRKAYGARPLFSGLDLEIAAGERLSLTGPSGCGKTTLGGILLRLVPPDAGEVRHHPGLAEGRVQKLYQDPSVAFAPRVPIRTGLRDVVRRHRADPARVHLLLERLGLDPALLDRRPGEVSGGELQRLAIIRAMLVEPRVLFADEPTSRLDLLTQEETVGCLMDQVVEHGAALVLVTHDLDLAAAVADRQVSLDGIHDAEPAESERTG
ncbi:ABC transporter ATP-binding protein [Kocuria dechangensis]|uniref:ABC transporter ATP-binding protein n=1 Tax=Kocuria dechangensis TaxID=1176249 RepID=A0A917GZ83_9MICC|nr:ATP-binding cassette domain-containing protein [Kocuria dechangensis]GGG62427.1 ABC transporter ATP-binding protein [Kocuria dechangensis]